MADDKAVFGRCLVIDDDVDIQLAARLALRGLFTEVMTFGAPEPAFAASADRPPDAILLDANFTRGATDGREGFLWLDRLLQRDPQAAVVMITAHGGVQIAVEAMKRGAIDFVSKPWSNDALVTTVRTAAALRQSQLNSDGPSTNEEAPAQVPGSPLIGRSPLMARVHSIIARAAPTDANVLVLGENGTGKELVARELHRLSRRADKPLVSVDLGAVAENLFDSELFGHMKGAFTDARADRVGRIESANGGTLFLDEVGNLPLYLQPKLLTALEQRKVTPVGANAPRSVDVRVVAATNLSPAQLADEGRFRQDLLFRLNTVEIRLPPLRERPEDVPVLLDHFLDHYAAKYQRPRREVPEAVMAVLMRHDWPGNVRALRHAAERATILATEGAFTLEDFALTAPTAPAPVIRVAPPPPPAVRDPSDPEGSDLNLDRAERQMIERALKLHSYNISRAAQALGLTRAALYRRMERHGL